MLSMLLITVSPWTNLLPRLYIVLILQQSFTIMFPPVNMILADILFETILHGLLARRSSDGIVNLSLETEKSRVNHTQQRSLYMNDQYSRMNN